MPPTTQSKHEASLDSIRLFFPEHSPHHDHQSNWRNKPHLHSLVHRDNNRVHARPHLLHSVSHLVGFLHGRSKRRGPPHSLPMLHCYRDNQPLDHRISWTKRRQLNETGNGSNYLTAPLLLNTFLTFYPIQTFLLYEIKDTMRLPSKQ